jgi:hypothetical protein
MGAGIRADVKSKQIVCHFIATRIRREASCVPRRPWPLRTSNVNAMHAKPRTKKKRRRRRLKNKKYRVVGQCPLENGMHEVSSGNEAYSWHDGGNE